MNRSKRRPLTPRAVIWLLASIAAAGIAANAHAQEAGVRGDRYDLLVAAADAAIELPEAEQSAKVAARYWTLFPREPLDGKPVPELAERLHAARTAAFYTHSPAIAEGGLDALHALEAKHAVTAQYVVQAFTALMSASELEAAAALARAHPEAGLARLPMRRTDASFAEDAPAEWVLSADGTSITRRAVRLGPGLAIVVVSHPQCHFSQRAIEAIAKDPALAEAFAQHGHWITPRLRDEDFEVIPEWNREHPGFAMTSVYDPNRWQGFDFRETPVFYFLVDGRIRQVVRGWPGDAQLASLKQAIAALAPTAPRVQAAANTRK